MNSYDREHLTGIRSNLLLEGYMSCRCKPQYEYNIISGGGTERHEGHYQ